MDADKNLDSIGGFTPSIQSRTTFMSHTRPCPAIGASQKNGYLERMDVSITEAKNRLSQLVRAVESGEDVILTRNGQPVAQLVRVPAGRPTARLGTMRGRIRFLPGWDVPIDLD